MVNNVNSNLLKSNDLYNFSLLSSSNSLPSFSSLGSTSLGSDSYTRSIDERKELLPSSFNLLRDSEYSQPKTYPDEEIGLPSVYSSGTPTDAPDLALNVILGIANGEVSSYKVMRDLFLDPVSKSFEDSSPEFVKDYTGQSIGGVPVGGYLSDVDNSKDARLQITTLQGRLGFITYLTDFLGQGLAGMTATLRKRFIQNFTKQGHNEADAQVLASKILENFLKKVPSFIGELERSANQIKGGIDRLQQVIQLKKNQTQAYNSQLKETINGFNGGTG